VLAAAMAGLIAEPDVRERMGTQGRERFEQVFRAEVVIGRIEGLYASLLG